MKRPQSTLVNMVLSLGCITIIAGAVLGAVYAVTKGPIARQDAQRQVDAIRQVTPQFDNDPTADKWEYTAQDGTSCTVYPAYSGGTLAGAAVMSLSQNGFAGEVSVMAGFNADGTIRDYQVLQQGETPGLGSKMQTWFRDTTAHRSVISKNPATEPLYVTKDKNGTVDGITAATISSRAFLEAMRDAFEAYTQYQQQKGGLK